VGLPLTIFSYNRVTIGWVCIGNWTCPFFDIVRDCILQPAVTHALLSYVIFYGLSITASNDGRSLPLGSLCVTVTQHQQLSTNSPTNSPTATANTELLHLEKAFVMVAAPRRIVSPRAAEKTLLPAAILLLCNESWQKTLSFCCHLRAAVKQRPLSPC
jgi:hypothetical protein